MAYMSGLFARAFAFYMVSNAPSQFDRFLRNIRISVCDFTLQFLFLWNISVNSTHNGSTNRPPVHGGDHFSLDSGSPSHIFQLRTNILLRDVHISTPACRLTIQWRSLKWHISFHFACRRRSLLDGSAAHGLVATLFARYRRIVDVYQRYLDGLVGIRGTRATQRAQSSSAKGLEGRERLGAAESPASTRHGR